MNNNNWWKSSVVYQIYPKSFKDSNGDGIGDIAGIIEELDYIKSLGVKVIWLTPIYVSPQNDNGYDIADYYNIDKMFGTIEDFKRLLDETHKRGMKLIMDMVVNHTSTENYWFKEALKGEDNPYHDFYIWRDKPNNWSSKFGGAAWEYVESLNKYYLHLFDVTQADLNWENPRVREEIFKIMRYWLDMGVDGFRLDVVNLLSKDQRFLDDDYTNANRDGRRFYTDGPRIHEYLNLMNKEVFSKYESIMTVGEMSSTNIENCIKYTNPDNQELDMVFNFHHLKVDYKNDKKWELMPFDFKKLKNLLFTWQVEMEKGNGWNALFWCNHDQPRIVSRFGNDTVYREESAKMLGTAIQLMRGTPYIYQGEEIGMTNPNFESIEKFRDVESLNAYDILLKKGIEEKEVLNILNNRSRDTSRTPMQWNKEKHGGFTKGTPWIDAAKNYNEINVESEEENENSILNYYRKLIKLREENEVISEGKFIPILEDHSQVLAYIREKDDKKIMVLCNFYEESTFVECEELSKIDEVLLTNSKENKIEGSKAFLGPYGSIVISINN
ncbi:alpha,alpha-phosphotrehalase [Caproiciproducens sp. MSJ-32]|uniref:alpha,alpha-phosphotrehalase n=1 Tax=Caproiciproducens sp. MSJ-32 TaxID=2841527 RepID=UPI001C1134DA|nr:alpha,alpha-phosphotrehalase [Caproiciproducens sp. MSJ-32]MBU5456012.1 alpha,alpha-phosphotrehalase [Caproiciproducens sp. MSJ-32]